MEELKIWFIEVAVKKMLPSLIKTSLMALIAYMAAHQNLLNNFGVTWDSSGHDIDIDLDKLSAWLLIVIPGAITAVMSAMQHHTAAVVTGKPQSGDMRTPPEVPVLGGERKEDPNVLIVTDTKK